MWIATLPNASSPTALEQLAADLWRSVMPEGDGAPLAQTDTPTSVDPSHAVRPWVTGRLAWAEMCATAVPLSEAATRLGVSDSALRRVVGTSGRRWLARRPGPTRALARVRLSASPQRRIRRGTRLPGRTASAARVATGYAPRCRGGLVGCAERGAVPWRSGAQPARVAGAHWAVRAGAGTHLTTGPTALTSRWGEAIATRWPDLGGAAYIASTRPARRAVAVWAADVTGTTLLPPRPHWR